MRCFCYDSQANRRAGGPLFLDVRIEVIHPENMQRLQQIVLSALRGRKRASKVPANALIRLVRRQFPECGLCDRGLAKVIGEAAVLLGLVPIYGSCKAQHRGEFNLPIERLH